MNLSFYLYLNLSYLFYLIFFIFFLCVLFYYFTILLNMLVAVFLVLYLWWFTLLCKALWSSVVVLKVLTNKVGLDWKYIPKVGTLGVGLAELNISDWSSSEAFYFASAAYRFLFTSTCGKSHGRLIASIVVNYLQKYTVIIPFCSTCWSFISVAFGATSQCLPSLRELNTASGNMPPCRNSFILDTSKINFLQTVIAYF